MKLTKIVAAGVVFLGITLCIYNVFWPRDVQGKVLVVLKNGNTVPLALLDVRALEHKDALSWKESLQRELDMILTEIKQVKKTSRESAQNSSSTVQLSLKTKRKQIDTITSQIVSAKKIWMYGDSTGLLKRDFFINIKAEPSPDSAEAIKLSEVGDWQGCHKSLSEARERLARDISDLEKRLENIDEKTSQEIAEKVSKLSASFSAKLRDESLSSVPAWIQAKDNDRTDESGAFRFKLPPGKYYLVTEGGRELLSGDENYYWAHPFEVPSKENDKLLLGNMNMRGAYSEDLWLSFKLKNLKLLNDSLSN